MSKILHFSQQGALASTNSLETAKAYLFSEGIFENIIQDVSVWLQVVDPGSYGQ